MPLLDRDCENHDDLGMEWLYGFLAEFGVKRLWAWFREMRSLTRRVAELEAENAALTKALANQPAVVRLDDTTTYVQQADGSRIVTKTTLARPVRIGGALGITGTGGATLKRPPADDDERPQ